MNSRIHLSLCAWLVILTLSSCQKKDKLDLDAPLIQLDASGTFPTTCTELQRGKEYTFQFTFSDQVSLGSYSIDIHHNFDQHSHSTETSSCTFDQKKQAQTPFLFIQAGEISEGTTTYTAKVQVEIPENVDTGDYHLTVQVTDRAGWSSRKGLSVKIVR